MKNSLQNREKLKQIHDWNSKWTDCCIEHFAAASTNESDFIFVLFLSTFHRFSASKFKDEQEEKRFLVIWHKVMFVILITSMFGLIFIQLSFFLKL